MVWLALSALCLLQVALFGIIFRKIAVKKTSDPRLHESAVLLESKILALHDFLESSDSKIRSMMNHIDSKIKEITVQKAELEKEQKSIEHCLAQAKDTMELFQEKIPNEEYLDRTTSQKYMQAAKLSNEGLSLDEIAAKIDIPKNEIELIFKLNSQTFSYAQDSESAEEPAEFAAKSSLRPITNSHPGLTDIGDRIRQHLQNDLQNGQQSQTSNSTTQPTSQKPGSLTAKQNNSTKPANGSKTLVGKNAQGKEIKVTKFEFPRLSK